MATLIRIRGAVRIATKFSTAPAHAVCHSFTMPAPPVQNGTLRSRKMTIPTPEKPPCTIVLVPQVLGKRKKESRCTTSRRKRSESFFQCRRCKRAGGAVYDTDDASGVVPLFLTLLLQKRKLVAPVSNTASHEPLNLNAFQKDDGKSQSLSSSAATTHDTANSLQSNPKFSHTQSPSSSSLRKGSHNKGRRESDSSIDLTSDVTLSTGTSSPHLSNPSSLPSHSARKSRKFAERSSPSAKKSTQTSSADPSPQSDSQASSPTSRHELKIGLPPIVSDDPAPLLLILGSAPSEESLRKRQYYGYKYNHFWPLVADLFQFPKDVAEMPYADRCEALCQRRVALWDVIHQCYRVGSSDSSIRGGTSAELSQSRGSTSGSSSNSGVAQTGKKRQEKQRQQDLITNGFASFFREHPTIRKVALNGGTAASWFQRKCVKRGLLPKHVEVLPTLPSTSPANAMKNAPAVKLERWRSIIGQDFINECLLSTSDSQPEGAGSLHSSGAN